MKTILVPTDFSPAANNAVQYAFNVARVVKANIKLCNAIQIPGESVMAGQVAWPLEDMESLKESSEAELNYLIHSLDKKSITADEAYHPRISHTTGIGNVTDFVRNLVNDHKVNLVVMGMSGANLFSKFVLGSNSYELIRKANFPLLLIPKNYANTSIKKIAFATDLSKTDIEALHSLANFARYYNAEILVTHVAEGVEDEQKQIDEFLSDVTCKVDYPHIYYRSMPTGAVKDGLNHLIENGRIDMLVMIHRSQGIFSSSYSQKMAAKTKIPLMVLPDGFDKLLI